MNQDRQMRVVRALVNRNHSENVVHLDFSLLRFNSRFQWMRQVDENQISQKHAEIGNTGEPQFLDDLAKISPVVLLAKYIRKLLKRLPIFLRNVRPSLVESMNRRRLQSRCNSEKRVQVVQLEKSLAESKKLIKNCFNFWTLSRARRGEKIFWNPLLEGILKFQKPPGHI